MEFLIIKGVKAIDDESIELIKNKLNSNGLKYIIKDDSEFFLENFTNKFVISVGGPSVNKISAIIKNIYKKTIDLSKYKSSTFHNFYGSQNGILVNNHNIGGCIAFWGEEAPDTFNYTKYFIEKDSILEDIVKNFNIWTFIDVFNFIVPIPAKTIKNKGNFLLFENTKIFIKSDELKNISEYLKSYITVALDIDVEIISNEDKITSNYIGLKVSNELENSNKEYYELSINENKIDIVANTQEGIFRGVQTLVQIILILSNSTNKADKKILIPLATIKDYPRFEWRGVMIDVARHFFEVEDIKKIIDRIALYKFNRLHLHLTDDQGWRIQIESWPRLELVGSASQVGGGKGGLYYKEDYKEIVEYAKKRYIIIIPEIDMPGHTNAALASYPELNESGIAPSYYTGTEVGFSSLAVRNEITYKFVEDVIKEISEITPGPYIHIGGDEARVTTPDDYKYFIERISKIVMKYGKILIGWEEISKCDLLPNSIVQYWHNKDYAIEAAKRGNKIILSPSKRIYLDMKYDKNTTLGTNWAGYINIETAYNWDPTTELSDISEDKILGVEAPLWTETIRSINEIEYMLFPRLFAVAEIGWSKRGRKIWNEFRERLTSQYSCLKKLNTSFFDINYFQ